MSAPPAASLADLYLADETAWLEAHAALIAAGRCDEIDMPHLAEYLADMANRDRKEVKSRLVVLLTHLLKWEYQPERRGGSWAGTIEEQRQELVDDLTSGTLRNHAAAVFAAAYAMARKRAAAETQLPVGTFPEACEWDLVGVLAEPVE